ncbi:MAG: phage tail tape measure protein [Campylobacteraceae bacterium]
MTNMALGIAINLGIKGLANITKVNTSFDELKKIAKSSSDNVQTLTKNLTAYRLNLQKINDIKLKQDGIRAELFNMKNLITGGALAVPIKLSIDFQSAMGDIKKVVDFANADEQKLFENQILKLSREIPLAATELAAIAAAGGQMGIAKESLIDFTTITAKMSTAFDMTADVAGDSMGKLMNVYKLNLNQAELLGDAINHLSDNSASKAREIVEVLQRVGGNAKVFGLTEQQAAALSSTFLSLGKSPEGASTAINTLLNKLSTAPSQGKAFQDTLRSIGMDAEYLKTAIEENPQAAIEGFLKQLSKIEKKDQMQAFTSLMGSGFDDDLALLVGGLEQYDKALFNTSSKEKYAGSMTREFATKSEEVAKQATNAKNALKQNGIIIGNVFLPAISSILKVVTLGAGTLADFMTKHESLTKVIVWATAGFIIFKMALLSIALIKNLVILKTLTLKNSYIALRIHTLATSGALTKKNIVLAIAELRLKAAIILTALYTKGLKLLSAGLLFSKNAFLFLAKGIRVVSLALLTNPIGLILTAIAVVAGLIIYNWDKVKVWFLKFIGWLSNLFSPAINKIKNIWNKLSSFLSPIFKPIIKAYTAVWSIFFKFIADKFSWISNVVDKIMGWITTAIKKTKELIGEISDFFGFGNDKDTTIIQSTDNKATIPTSNVAHDFLYNKESVLLPKSSGSSGGSYNSSSTININLNGDMLMQGKDGKYDMEDFKKEIIRATKQSISTDNKNAKNRSIL